MASANADYPAPEFDSEIDPPNANNNLGFMPFQRNPQTDSILNKHLDSSKILEEIEMMLKGKERNESNAWVDSYKIIGYDNDGREIKQKEGYLLEPGEIKSVMTYLKAFLSSNTYLSYLDKEEIINDTMIDLNFQLMKLFYRLKNKISPTERDTLWSMIEYPILFAMKRAQSKVTLDAASKMQHSVEHINAGQPQSQKKDEFKFFGW